VSNALLVAEVGASSGPIVVPGGVAIRVLEEGDLSQVAEAYWRTYLGTADEMSRADAAAEIRGSWDGEYGRLLAGGSMGAWFDGVLAGAVLTVQDAPWPDVPPGPFIIDLFVVPPQRRRGIGRALVATVQDNLRASIGLRVDDAAHEARALYASLGFRELPS
jgi:GNAT superfamily N-acetyltransferase